MAKPVLLSVDDDPEVLRAVARDLRRQYGETYRILRAESGDTALEALEQLRLRNEPVALLLVDQRMPRMTGVELLERARELFPDAKRVLLTAYADTEAAIRAINTAQVDFYLLKPWDPPEEKLYPVLDDLLADWQAGFRPGFEGMRVLGHQWSPRAYEIKEFLARNHVPFQWLDVQTSDEARQLVARVGGDGAGLPVVLLADGTHLRQPSNLELAEKIGLQTEAEQPFYDLVIVGGGPAGLAAAVYGASEGLRTVMIERQAPGGQAGTSSRIENYLGFPSGLSGGELARRAVAQARRFGVEILTPREAAGVRVQDPYRFVRLASGSELTCFALLISTGVAWRTLEAPGIDRLAGAGVYYGAAMTEAETCRDQRVFIVGAGNSAGQAAVYLARFAAEVNLLVRGDSLAKSMSQYLIDQIGELTNIRTRFHTEVVEVQGEDHLKSVTLVNRETHECYSEPTSSLFVMIGAVPHTEWLDGVVQRDPKGFILSGPDLMRDGKRPPGWRPDRDPFLLETSVPGIFVAGDVRRASVKRVASGVGEGSIAIQFVHQYLSEVR